MCWDYDTKVKGFYLDGSWVFLLFGFCLVVVGHFLPFVVVVLFGFLNKGEKNNNKKSTMWFNTLFRMQLARVKCLLLWSAPCDVSSLGKLVRCCASVTSHWCGWAWTEMQGSQTEDSGLKKPKGVQGRRKCQNWIRIDCACSYLAELTRK